MIPTALFICRSNNDFGGGRKIFGDPIRAAAVGRLIESRPDTDGADAGIMRALGVDLLVANQKRPRKIDIVIAGRLKDRNIRRDPRVSVTIMQRENPENYTEIRGVATITDEGGLKLDNDLSWKYDGKDAGEDATGAVRVVVRVEPAKVAGHVK